MQIELSKKEYRNLLDLLIIAEFVLNGHKLEQDKSNEKYSEVMQKIFSYADKAGFTGLIEFDGKQYYPTQEIEENNLKHIDDHDNESFWYELLNRMVVRDLINELGEKKYRKLSDDECREKEEPLIEQYSAEFERNGIDNLVIK